MASVSARDHLPILDGLRGLAALVVVISHCANAQLLPAILGQGFGQMGVGLFYGLSGLLMGRLYLARAFNRTEITDYAWRRGARVLPLYYAALAVGVILLFGFDLSPYHLQDIQDVLWAAGLLQGTGVLWSIPAEIQFYVVFLGLWWAAQRRLLLWAIVGLLLLQGLVATAIYSLHGMKYTYSLAFWMHLFLAGTLLGQISTRPWFDAVQDRLRRRKEPLLVLGTVVLLLAGVLAPPGVRNAIGVPNTYPFADPLSVGYPLALLVAGLFGAGVMHVFAAPIWRWLGKVSFSVYLVHMPVLLAVVTIPGTAALAPALQVVLVFAITFAISACTQSWIEVKAQRAILKLEPRNRPRVPQRSSTY
ncbi:MAG: hypothetical protein BM562_04910 [Alphaproteobacteria bacterium MedPE-SWcel]|nr:MAG: hypothetical protein BM562_04910 [Alphaproteobacteria bacterium MedPE-SWcel]